ncbi:MAG: dipeptidase [Bacillota bacterium]
MTGIKIADCHCDTLLKVNAGEANFINPGNCHIDLPKMKKAGIMMQFMAIYVHSHFKPQSALRRSLELVKTFYDLLNNPEVMHIRYKEDLDLLLENYPNHVGLLLSLEGAEPIENMDILDIAFILGVRSIGLTWNIRNMLADGIDESSTKGGLTSFGKQVIKRMNQLGMLVDVSHISEAGFWDVIRVANAPIIASHSNCYALCPHLRNLKDEQIIQIAETKGFIGITFYPEFIGLNKDLDSIVDHINYVVNLVGIEHVAIGSDFDGAKFTIKGLEDASQYHNLIRKLYDKGYKTDEVQRIMGYNIINTLQRILPGRKQ